MGMPPPYASPFDLNEEVLRWYDSLLKGIGNGLDHEKPVRIFVMGKSDWREEDDWPLALAKATGITCTRPSQRTVLKEAAR